MPELKKINKIEIRSEEVQEILGATPRWLIRGGISVILLVVVALLIGSCFFKYPDIILSQVTLTTQNPPVQLKTLTNGKITDLFAIENQSVNQNEVIAIIENTANYKDVKDLKSTLDTLNRFENYSDSVNLLLGEIQSYFSSFNRLLKDFRNFKNLDYYNEKIKSVRKQISDYNLYYNRLLTLVDLQKQGLSIAKTQIERDKTLFDKGVHSKADYEKAEKVYLQQELSYESSRATLSNTKMQINQLDQQILDLKLQKTQDESMQQIAIEEAIQNLKSQISKWEQTYLIISPIDGQVTFTKIWSTNQNVQAGEIVATVIPNNETKIIGKILIPSVGVGKVKIGQKVNIKLDNFPYMEFGLLKGKIRNISLVPISTDNGTFYTAELEIPKTLISNYGRELEFSQEMSGIAEIITDDITLFERFFNPIKSLVNRNK